MQTQPAHDAVIIGAGPNGLTAAIMLARAGLSVLVLEAGETLGGGARTAELTLPGFYHDVCATILTTALISPVMQSLPLEEHGVEWVHPEIPLAHPFDDGTAAALHRSIEETAEGLGADSRAYRFMLGPLARHWQDIIASILGPVPLPRGNPLPLVDFGFWALQPAALTARAAFRTPQARGLFAGLSAHGILPLHWPGTASFGLVLAMGAHGVGWPVVRGGTQQFANALAAILAASGGQVVLGQKTTSLKEIPPARTVLFDVTPRSFVNIAGDALPPGYRRALSRYRYGPGVCKVDYALSAPIPWRSPDCARAGSVHIGGSLEEIQASESRVWAGEHVEHPYTLLVQPTIFDPTRAPAGNHIAWAYCHVPNGSTRDVSDRITAQIERFAPGFRDLILAKHVYTASEMEAYNPNYVGGDINSGAQDLTQLFTRPVPRWTPYSTPLKGMYLCSSSTPPGGGLHGMCGFHAANDALRQVFHLPTSRL